MSFLSPLSAYPPEQMAYMQRVREILLNRYSSPPKAHIITYGCQQNVSDSERIKGMLVAMGYTLTDSPEGADFVLFNTCAVRGHAEDRVYGNVGGMKQYKRKRPNMIVAVCGCMAQQEKVAEKFKFSYPYVDLVFGTQVEHRLPEFIYRRIKEGKRIFELSLDNKDIIEDIPVNRDGDVKGWLPIMYGCNNFCTYCIVPYVRGRERSREPEKILQEARSMVKAGYKEIMLLGQNVNSYGIGCDHGINFAKLLRMINGIEGDFRIRFMTSHPKDCTVELLEAIRDCEKVERRLHLPMQSGSSRILKLMNRRYTREKYLELINNAKRIIPDVVFTSDIIVGFPGETYEDFKETLSLVKEVEYSSLFTFIFSPRDGTPAAAMADPVSREEKGRWFAELLREQDIIGLKKQRELVGKTVRVLCEEPSSREGYIVGKTAGTASVEFAGDLSFIGKFANIKIESFTNILNGSLVE